jgi:plasmid stabilization system protein ParE
VPAKLLWSLQERENLLDIYVAIGMENAEAAERLYSAIKAKAKGLQHFHCSGVEPASSGSLIHSNSPSDLLVSL